MACSLLPVSHLPGHHNVVFYPDHPLEEVVDSVKDTQLLGWFKANADPVLIAAGADDCLYQDFEKKFVWVKTIGVWKVHQRYKAIGQMYSISPNAEEGFYLCLLLTAVKGM